MIPLPVNIDYTKYNGTEGMSTKHWGPAYWVFLFTSVMGSYPVKVDWDNNDHVIISKEFKNTITSLVYILPCIFCRESFNTYISELPIEPYLVGRIELMFWLYLIKNKVNTKLIRQERKALIKAMEEMSELDFEECVKNSFYTTKTPPFEEVLDHYESLRAVCSKDIKKCVIMKND